MTSPDSDDTGNDAHRLMKQELLSDWGEFRLLEKIVFPALDHVAVPSGLGDDAGASELPPGDVELVVTTDCAATPLVFSLGARSFDVLGWYAVHINASDLAASGATPLVFVSSVEAPPSMPVTDFEQFFKGMASACHAFGMRNAGGNLNEGKAFSCHGSAIGTVQKGKRIRRSGCKPGCLIVSIGECGLFAAAYMKALRVGLSNLEEELRNRLSMPRPRLQEMLTLHANELVAAASDCSDGVLGTLWNISEASGCTIVVEMDDTKLPQIVSIESELATLNPWNLMFFWGDWQVICAVPPDEWEKFERVAGEASIPYVLLGHAEEGPAAVWGVRHGVRQRLRVVRNEHFLPTSYSNEGAQCVEYFLKTELFSMPTHSKPATRDA